MSFSYSGNPGASQLDAMRFYLSDTDGTTALLQDEEINFVIAQYPNLPNKQLAVLFRQMATHFGSRVAKRSLGPQSEDTTARLAYFQAQADKYEKMQSFSGVPPLPDYDYEKVFTKGMLANED